MADQPNIVLLVLDTLRAKNVSCYGYERETTPFLDSLAEEGVQYMNAYTVSPWTLPAHASLFTGTYPSEHGAGPARGLDAEYETMAARLSYEGYSTLAVTNNVWVTPERGFERGFDSFELMWQRFDTPDVAAPIVSQEPTWKRILSMLGNLLGGNVVKRVANLIHGYRYQKSRRRAEKTNHRVMGELGEEPFFLFVNYMEPHTPYRPPREYAERFLPEGVDFEEADSLPQEPWEYVFGDRDYSEEDFEILESLYDAAVAYLDDQLMDLVEEIEERTERDTMFVFLSDHGENIGDHGLMAHHYSLENTVMRVPLILRGSGFDGGGAVQIPADLVDVHRTILESVGADATGSRGKNLLEGRAAKDVFAQYDSPLPPVERLEERFGVSEDDLNGRHELDAMVKDEHKLVRFADRSELRTNDYEEERVEDEDLKEQMRKALESQESGLSESYNQEKQGDDSDLRKRLEELGYY